MNHVPKHIKLKAIVATLEEAEAPEVLIRAIKSLIRIDVEDRLDYASRFGRNHELTLDDLILPDGRLRFFRSVRLLIKGGKIIGYEILPVIGPGEDGDDEVDQHLKHGLTMDFSDLRRIVTRNRAGEIVELFSIGNSRRDMLVRKTVFKSLFRALSYTQEDELKAANEAIGLGGDNGRPVKVTRRHRHRIAAAIYAEIFRTVFGKRHAAALALFAAMPPARIPAFSELLILDNPQDIIDLIVQLPIIIAWPERLAAFFAGDGWRLKDVLSELGLGKGFRKISLTAAGGLLYLHGAQARPRGDMEVKDFAYLTPEAMRHCPDAGWRQKACIFIAALFLRQTGDVARAGEILKWSFIKSEAVKVKAQFTLEHAGAIAGYFASASEDLDAAGIPHPNDEISLATAKERGDRLIDYRNLRGKAGDLSETLYPVADWMPRDGQITGSSIWLARIPHEAACFAEASRNNNCLYANYEGEARSGFAGLYALRRLPRKGDPQNKIFFCDLLKIEVVNIGCARLYRDGDGAYAGETADPHNRPLAVRYRLAIEAHIAPAPKGE